MIALAWCDGLGPLRLFLAGGSCAQCELQTAMAAAMSWLAVVFVLNGVAGDGFEEMDDGIGWRWAVHLCRHDCCGSSRIGISLSRAIATLFCKRRLRSDGAATQLGRLASWLAGACVPNSFVGSGFDLMDAALLQDFRHCCSSGCGSSGSACPCGVWCGCMHWFFRLWLGSQWWREVAFILIFCRDFFGPCINSGREKMVGDSSFIPFVEDPWCKQKMWCHCSTHAAAV